jgi:fido (protein-threonine AMPylation protein)
MCRPGASQPLFASFLATFAPSRNKKPIRRTKSRFAFTTGSPWIHPFPNGNGRLARLAADLLAVQLGEKRFTWGSGNLGPASGLRKRYIDAQQAADDQVVEPLLEFARS